MEYRDVIVPNGKLTSDERDQFEWILVLFMVYNETYGDAERWVTVGELISKFSVTYDAQVGATLRWLYMCGYVTRIGDGVAYHPFQYRLSDAGAMVLLGHVKGGLLHR